jgi:hypothetical protein
MSLPPVAHRSILWRCALVGLLVAVPTACKSSRSPATITTVSTTSTTSTTTSTTTTSTTSTTTTTLPPTTTTEPLITEGGIVMVANASGVNRAAKELTTEFAALGFTTRTGTNAAGIDEDLATTKIYVIAGSEAVAQSVSRLMGGVPVERMPTPAWIVGGTAGLGDANVLVMLGHDLAGTPLADMRD